MGIRPALVIQNDVGNRASSTTIVAAITTRFDRVYPFMAELGQGEGELPLPGVVNLSQLFTVSQGRLLPPRGEQTLRAVGHLQYPRMEAVDRALRVSIGLR
jgi:mRNA interferase MazF